MSLLQEWLVPIVVVLLVAAIINAIKYNKLPNPGVYHWPVFGATYAFMSRFDEIPDWIVNVNSEKGFTRETWSFSMLQFGPFAKGAWCINDPKTLQHVTKDQFPKYGLGDIREPLEDFLGSGIFRVDGKTWNFHRKVAVQMFSRYLLREGTHIAMMKTKQLSKILKSHAGSKEPVDLQRLFFGLTMDVFAILAFGIDVDSIEKDHEFAMAFDEVQELCNNRFRNPLWKLGRAIRTPTERKITKGVKTMREFAKNVIKSKRDSDARGDELGPDLIARFIKGARSNPSDKVSDEEMMDVVLNFIIAGRDTTASALSWTIFELSQNPKYIDMLLAELTEALERRFDSAQLSELTHEETFELVDGELPLCKSVLWETLRMHPSVMKQLKYAMEADVLPDGTKISEGEAIFWSPYSMGRDPTLWDEPNTFNPDRFMTAEQKDPESTKKKTSLYDPPENGVSDYHMPVFNSGKRLCIGRPLAFLEMKLVLISLLPQFKFELAGKPDPSYKNSLVSPLKNGLPVFVQVRE